MLKKTSLIFFFISITFFNTHLSSSEKIYFIDLDFIYSSSVLGKELNNEIKKRSENLNKEIKKYENQIKEKKVKLNAQKNILSEDEFKEKINKLDADIKSMNSDISKKRKDLISFQNKLRKDF